MATVEVGGIYKIVNGLSGTVIDLNNSNNRTVAGYSFHGGANQQWEASVTDAGTWRFKNVATGLYLGIDGEAKDGAPVIASSHPFGWNIWPDDEDKNTLRICIPNTTQNIDLSDHGNANPGTAVQSWGRWQGRNQVWKFERAN